MPHTLVLVALAILAAAVVYWIATLVIAGARDRDDQRSAGSRH